MEGPGEEADGETAEERGWSSEPAGIIIINRNAGVGRIKKGLLDRLIFI